MEPRVRLPIEGRDVELRAWRYAIRGVNGHHVDVYLLDSDLPSNSEHDRTLTDRLYGGDARFRLSQEAVLGIGGAAMLRALGYSDVHTFHLNEGHSALLALAMIEDHLARREGSTPAEADVAFVRQHCVFTTHTAVSAGHDQFSSDLVREVLGQRRTETLTSIGAIVDGTLNMTRLALDHTRFTNGVAMRHAEIARRMFAGRRIDAITNGVHVPTWTAPPFAALFDRHIPVWRRETANLRHAVGIPLNEIEAAHRESKQALLDEIARRTGRVLRPDLLTIGSARRVALYKRGDLLFSDPERLLRIASERGALQLVYAGKAHPDDEPAKALIQRVFAGGQAVNHVIDFVYLEDYDMDLGRLLCSGADLWLNTPQPPLEASGTSGMKAALNGVPSLSVLDGWWVEGHIEGATGWAIGDNTAEDAGPERDAQALYDKLEWAVMPTYYRRPREYTEIRRTAIAVNGSHFTAQRMMQQYVNGAYELQSR